MRCLLVAFLVAAGAASAADVIVGAARVVDGDTLEIGDDRIRMSSDIRNGPLCDTRN